MKKKFTIIFILIYTNIFIFAQNSFSDFVYKNPFLDDLEVYIDNPDLLKGKIFKTVIETYDLTSDGKKKYGDAYCTEKGIKYFYFDNENILREKILIGLSDDKVDTKKSWQYISKENGYSVLYNNYDNNLEKNEEYSCYEDRMSNEIIFKYYEDEFKLTREVQLKNGKKIKIEQKYDWNPYIDEYVYEGNLCIVTNKNGTELNRTIIYQNGKEIKNVQEGYKGNGKIVVLYDLNKTMTEGIKKTQIFMNGVLKEEKITSKIVRKYNPAGFVEYEKITPYEGTVGTYITYTAEILDAEDDFLKNIKIK